MNSKTETEKMRTATGLLKTICIILLNEYDRITEIMTTLILLRIGKGITTTMKLNSYRCGECEIMEGR